MTVLTPLPTPAPSRQDPANFATRADALVAALPTLVAEINAAGGVNVGNATTLLGATWAAPGAIGSTTPSTGAFTTLSTTGTITGGSTIQASGALLVASSGGGYDYVRVLSTNSVDLRMEAYGGGPWGQIGTQSNHPVKLIANNTLALTATGANLQAAGTLGVTGAVTCSSSLSVPSTNPLYLDGGSDTYWQEIAANTVRLIAGGGELIRFTSSTGATLITGQLSTNGTGKNTITTSVSADYNTLFTSSTGTTPVGIAIYYSSLDPNGTSNDFIECIGTSTLRAGIRSNGGLANFSANNVNLSDAETKTPLDVIDRTKAQMYWDANKKIEYGTFLFKDQTDIYTNLGTTAQSVEAAAPWLTDGAYFDEFEKVDSGYVGADFEPIKVKRRKPNPLKGVYETDRHYQDSIVLQEAQHRIEEMAGQIAALKSAFEQFKGAMQ
jgi:hypothetical protein